MRKLIFTLIIPLISAKAFCQADSLLQKFKYRIDHYRAINFSLDAANMQSGFAQPSINNTNTSTGANFSGNFNVIKSTDRQIFSINGTLYGSAGQQKSKSSTATARANNSGAGGTLGLQSRWFNRENFTELGAGLGFNFAGARQSYSDDGNIFRSRQTRPEIKLSTGIGKGRLENVTDMQNALWLSKALSEEKRLLRQLSGEELNGLGRAITQANNTRVLDTRRRIQYILEKTDAYLQQTGVLDNKDIRYFSTLNDILFFAPYTTRLSGKERFIRLAGVYNQNRSKGVYTLPQEEYFDKTEEKSILLTAGFHFYKPANLTHQNNYGVSANLSKRKFPINSRRTSGGIITTDISRSWDFKRAGISAFYEHGFYPGTRTIVTTGITTESGYQKSGDESGFYNITNFSANLSYFISYRSRFWVISELALNHKNYINNTLYNPDNAVNRFYFNAGLTVSL
ncbi:MAG: hypothetical protein NTW29_15425 [Bacteroidetes bacterium]|nr:hypothetical protein [Bacteroidota bacterium]